MLRFFEICLASDAFLRSTSRRSFLLAPEGVGGPLHLDSSLTGSNGPPTPSFPPTRPARAPSDPLNPSNAAPPVRAEWATHLPFESLTPPQISITSPSKPRGSLKFTGSPF